MLHKYLMQISNFVNRKSREQWMREKEVTLPIACCGEGQIDFWLIYKKYYRYSAKVTDITSL